MLGNDILLKVDAYAKKSSSEVFKNPIIQERVHTRTWDGDK